MLQKSCYWFSCLITNRVSDTNKAMHTFFQLRKDFLVIFITLDDYDDDDLFAELLCFSTTFKVYSFITF